MSVAMQLNWARAGEGPVVVLSHALGCDLTMWDGVAAVLRRRHTVLRYDHRGHGRSPAAATDFTMADLAEDAAAFIREQGGGPVHFVGLSMGGMTAQALAARHPALLASVTVANAAQHYDAAARALWQQRIATVRASGLAAIADGALQRWFTPEFRRVSTREVTRLRQVLEGTDPASYAAACAAVAAIDLAAGNARSTVPTLVIAGTRDEATPPALAEAIAAATPGARLQTLDAAHLSAVEQPQAFAELLTTFWAAPRP